jgi:hypothetical protein
VIRAIVGPSLYAIRMTCDPVPGADMGAAPRVLPSHRGWGLAGAMMPILVDFAGVTSLIRLADHGIGVWLFGGWAEEARGLVLPRPHKDVDLLYRGSDFAPLDDFLRRTPGIQEVAVKRSPYSRAFEDGDDFAEFYLVQEDRDGFFTDF